MATVGTTVVTKILTSGVGIAAVLGVGFYIFNYTEIGTNIKCLLNPTSCFENKLKQGVKYLREGEQLFNKDVKPKLIAAEHTVVNAVKTDFTKVDTSLHNASNKVKTTFQRDKHVVVNKLEHNALTNKIHNIFHR